MKKPLTIKKMLLISAVFLILDAVFLYMRMRSSVNWLTPSAAKFLMKDCFLIIAWIVYFLQRKKQ